VLNEMTIEPTTPLTVQNNDSWITTKVKAKMVAENTLHSRDIKILTEDGTVFLMGDLNPDQAELATQIARQITGVTRVVTVFSFPNEAAHSEAAER
jgi:osmotically-inducible protein OsmY